MIVFISFFHFSFVAIFDRGHMTSRLQLRFPLMYFMFPQFLIFHVHFGWFFYPPFSVSGGVFGCFVLCFPCDHVRFRFFFSFFCVRWSFFSLFLRFLFFIRFQYYTDSGTRFHCPFFLASEFNSPLRSGCFFCSFFPFFCFHVPVHFYINDKTNHKC